MDDSERVSASHNDGVPRVSNTRVAETTKTVGTSCAQCVELQLSSSNDTARCLSCQRRGEVGTYASPLDLVKLVDSVTDSWKAHFPYAFSRREHDVSLGKFPPTAWESEPRPDHMYGLPATSMKGLPTDPDPEWYSRRSSADLSNDVHAPTPRSVVDSGYGSMYDLGGRFGQSSEYRNVSACNSCRLRKYHCDQELPSCASCIKAGVACVGYDPITKKEIPRSYVFYLENKVEKLEKLLAADDGSTYGLTEAGPVSNSLAQEGFGVLKSIGTTEDAEIGNVIISQTRKAFPYVKIFDTSWVEGPLERRATNVAAAVATGVVVASRINCKDIKWALRRTIPGWMKEMAGFFDDSKYGRFHIFLSNKASSNIITYLDSWFPTHQEHKANPNPLPAGADATGTKPSLLQTTYLLRQPLSLEFDEPWIKIDVEAIIRLGTGSHKTKLSVRDIALDSMRHLRHLTQATGSLADLQIPYLVFEAIFHVDWDPSHFLDNQEYSEQPDDVIGRVLTLTGDAQSFQCCSPREYMEQLWPSKGDSILDMLSDFLANPSSHRQDRFDDGTAITFSRPSRQLEVKAVGSHYGIARVAEKLCWLGCALQIPPESNAFHRFTSCSRLTAVRFSPRAFRQEGSMKLVGSVDFYMNFDVKPVAMLQSNHSLMDRCWEQLFRNYVVVEGFPVPTRLSKRGGMEMSFDVMASLIRGRWLTVMDDNLILKGFSRLLYAVDLPGEDTIFWHLISSEDGSRIAYTDDRIKSNAKIEAFELLERIRLGSVRHIVGWSSNVRNHTGSQKASYDIRGCDLPRPASRTSLEQVQLGFSMYVQMNTTIALGKKDRPLSLIDDGDFNHKIAWLAGKYVLLHDVVDRVGWLVDGASALLHLLRASIHHDSKSRFKDVMGFENIQFQEVEPSKQFTGADAAVQFLTNVDNLSQPLSSRRVFDRSNPAQTTAVTEFVQDRIERLSHLLEKLIDHQAAQGTEPGLQFRARGDPLANYIQGFDFKDIAKRDSPYEPKEVEIGPHGKSWIGLIRSMRAITLFGKGFGQLIQQVETSTKECGTCFWQSPVPTGHDLLAVCEEDLKGFMRDKRQDVWCFKDEIYWDTPAKAFEPCVCKGRKLGRRIQTLRYGRESKTSEALCKKMERTIHKVLQGSSSKNAASSTSDLTTASTEFSTSEDSRSNAGPRATLFGENFIYNPKSKQQPDNITPHPNRIELQVFDSDLGRASSTTQGYASSNSSMDPSTSSHSSLGAFEPDSMESGEGSLVHSSLKRKLGSQSSLDVDASQGSVLQEEIHGSGEEYVSPDRLAKRRGKQREY